MNLSPAATDGAAWARTGNSLKTRWVAAVVAFWVSLLVLVVVFFAEGGLDPVLASICLGLLFVGVWLKARYRHHQRKGPGEH